MDEQDLVDVELLDDEVDLPPVRRPEGHGPASLAELLAGDRHGVFVVAADDNRDLAGAADDERWDVVAVDTSDCGDKAGFMSLVSDAFDLPGWFDGSWESLDLCLRALDLDDPEGMLVIWTGWGAFAESDPDGFETAVEVFQNACVAWGDDEVGGGVVLTGPGPETDLPPLR